MNRNLSRNFNSDERLAKNIGCGIFAIWAVSALMGLALFGVIIWGIIALVSHYT